MTHLAFCLRNLNEILKNFVTFSDKLSSFPELLEIRNFSLHVGTYKKLSGHNIDTN